MRLLGFRLEEKREHLAGQFVSLARPSLARRQSWESFLRKSRFGLIERGAGEAEVETGLAYRSPLDSHPAEHFVFDLNQVPWIEEVAVEKERIGHRLRARIG